ncbi:MAG: hypothetical protein OXE79_07225 [Acidimicrobiaceae bacterium]|nr:hypothetical protein [Acidimicrobiaceae bacterium]MCY4280697.1 hypothetical protein [Acidimicrobiaceae bacterium]MCY4293268.1 hypothetical protein [Acidimicrobiaceae bacterium]
MSADDVIANALSLGSGARFMRCALQVNPAHYRSTFQGAERAEQAAQLESATDYTSAMVAKAQETGVSVLAITDHNSVRDISLFRAAAQGTDVTILPGFELESTEGIHVLCIYSPALEDQKLERLLGEFGVRDTEPSSAQCEFDFATVLSKVRDQGGIAIAAHSTGEKGLFKALSGQARIRAWQCPDLLAVQIPGSIEQLPEDVRGILKDKNPDYERDFPASHRQAVAALNAKDVTKPEELEAPSATCWIKMTDEVTVEGLRQAFLDPDSRIRLNSDPAPVEHSELVIMRDYGYIEARGMGIRHKVIPSMADHNGTEPKFAEGEHCFTVSLLK